MKQDIIILEYTLHTKPCTYLAVECSDNNVYEIPLYILFETQFISDGNLEQYYIKNHSNYIDLYKDLLTLDYDIEGAILDILNDVEIINYIYPIPRGIYPIVLRYYYGKASSTDMKILEQALELGIVPLRDKPKNRGYGGSSN